MATDRLAVSRAQRQPQVQALEMTGFQSNHVVRGHELTGMPAFLSEITTIQDGVERINVNVTRISGLHSRSMNALGEGSHQDAADLDALVAETRILTNELKERIKQLEASSETGKDTTMRKDQFRLVRSKFLEAIQNYRMVELQRQTKARQRVERQFKIVKPDATPEEVSAVVDGGRNQIFAQALTSTRYEDSRAAYQKVQDRQQDLWKMEQTLAELSELIEDMGILIEQQDVTVKAIVDRSNEVKEDTEAALKGMTKATQIGHALRRKKWICFWIVVFVLVVIAAGIGIKIGVDGGLK